MKFNFNLFRNRIQIFQSAKNIETYGTCEGRKAIGYSTSALSKTLKNVIRVPEFVSESSFRFLRRMSRKHGMSSSFVQCILIKEPRPYL